MTEMATPFEPIVIIVLPLTFTIRVCCDTPLATAVDLRGLSSNNVPSNFRMEEANPASASTPLTLDLLEHNRL